MESNETEKRKLKIRLADTDIEILTDSDYMFSFCKNYISDSDHVDFVVETDQSDIEYEMERFEERNNVSYLYRPSKGTLESLAVYRKIAEKMIERNTLLFHGSAIAVDGVCYLFCADSGTGKSTHTRLWREHFKERAVMINDDKPLIQIKDEIKVFGTPWSGKHHLDTNTSVPLRAVCFLERGEQNSIEPIPSSEALAHLLRFSYRSNNPVNVSKELGLLVRMSEKLSFYRLHCNMEPDACIVSYNGMKAGDGNE